MPGTAAASRQTNRRDENVDRTTIEHDRGDTSTRNDRGGPHGILDGATAPVAIGGGDEPVLLFGTRGGHRHDGT